jgi:hypothetical protein
VLGWGGLHGEEKKKGGKQAGERFGRKGFRIFKIHFFFLDLIHASKSIQI